MESKRRITLPERKAAAEVKIGLDDITPESVLRDALNTAAIEVARYRVKVGRGQALDLKEARIVQGWIKSMTDVMKEVREQEKSSKLEDLSNEELLALARRVVNSNEAPIIETQHEEEETDDETESES